MTHVEAERRDSLHDHYIERVKQLEQHATFSTALLLDFIDALDLTDENARQEALGAAYEAGKKFILTAGA